MNLSDFDQQFNDTAVPERKAKDAVPDGKYQVRVESAVMKTASTGAEMLALDLVVVGGVHAGRHLFKNCVISAGSLPYLKQDLVTLGWSKPLSALANDDDRASLLDITLQVTKKTKGDNSNVYIDKRVAVTAASGPVAGSDAAPF